jgi:hypothetical protein
MCVVSEVVWNSINVVWRLFGTLFTWFWRLFGTVLCYFCMLFGTVVTLFGNSSVQYCIYVVSEIVRYRICGVSEIVWYSIYVISEIVRYSIYVVLEVVRYSIDNGSVGIDVSPPPCQCEKSVSPHAKNTQRYILTKYEQRFPCSGFLRTQAGNPLHWSCLTCIC